MGGKGFSSIIYLIIIAFLSLTLTFLAVYVFVLNGAAKNTATNTPTHGATTDIPDDDELVAKSLYEGDGKNLFNLKSSNNKNSVLQVRITIKYFKALKGFKEKDIESRIDAKLPEIRESVSLYFTGLTLEDICPPENRPKMKNDLKDKMNHILSGTEPSTEFVYDVIIEDIFWQ